jgi:hypothetical protein
MVAAESVKDVVPVHAVVTNAPAGIPLPAITDPVLMPVASATTIVVAPEAKVAMVATLGTELIFSLSVTARDQVVVSFVQ